MMDGFTGFESAAGEEFPKACAVIDPFHVVSLAFSKLDQCRRRTQRASRTLCTGVGLLADTQVVPTFFDYPCAPAAPPKRSTSLWVSAVSPATSFAASSIPDASRTASSNHYNPTIGPFTHPQTRRTNLSI